MESEGGKIEIGQDYPGMQRKAGIIEEK